MRGAPQEAGIPELDERDQSEHPLADDKAAREFIAELPPIDPYKTLDELTFWLDSLTTAEDLKLSRELEIVDLVDQAAKNYQRKLSQEYLSNSARFRNSRKSVSEYGVPVLETFGRCLPRCLAHFQSGGAHGVRSKGRCRGRGPGAARVRRCSSTGNCCVTVRSRPGSGGRSASSTPMPRTRVRHGALHRLSGTFGASTVQREFLKVVMLNISSTDSLLPAKLEIAERMVAQFSEFFVMSRQPAKGRHYHFDLNEDKLPHACSRACR